MVATAAASGEGRPRQLATDTRFVAGAASVLTGDGAAHPLDPVKIRMQVRRGELVAQLALALEFKTHARGAGVRRYGERLRPAYRSVVMLRRREEGSALYRGVSANLCGSGVAWGVYFYTYDTVKQALMATGLRRASRRRGHRRAAAAARASVLLTNPLWVVKTRMHAARCEPQSATRALGRPDPTWRGMRACAASGPRRSPACSAPGTAPCNSSCV